MTKSRIKDQFLYALLATVFAAVAVVVTWSWSEEQKTVPKVEQIQVLGAQTPNELMQELYKTVDNSSEMDIDALKQEAGAL